MAAYCKPPIFHLHHSLPPPPPPPQPPHATATRRLFLFSLPLCTTSIAVTSNVTYFSRFLMSPYEALASESPYDPVSKAERYESEKKSKRVMEGLELLDKGKELQASGDFNKALAYFTLVVENYKEFAFTEYARVGRALALYEVGDREEAIAEMEDVSISLKGYPEVHAALAAALYVDKHAPLLAENQFTIATLLDPHYTDISYVKETKHWPPSLVSSLQLFITLS